MRKLLVVLAAIVVIVAAGFGALFLLIDVNQFRGTLQNSLQSQLKRPVTLGTMTLGLIPFAIKVENVSIGENPQFATGRPFATVKEIRVSAELLPLLRKDVRVNSLVLEQPVIEIVSDKTGSYNFSDLTNRPASGQPPSSGSIALSQIDIEDGTVATSTLGNPASRSVYDHIDVTATDVGAGRNPHIKASARLAGAAKDSLTFQGTGSPLAGVLTLTDVPMAGLSRFAGSALPIDGLLSGSANVRSAGPLTTAQGRLDLKKATANGHDLGAPFSLDYDLSDDSRSDVVHVSRVDLKAGKLGALRGSFDMTGGATRNINFNFDIDKVDVPAMQQVSGPASAGSKSPSPAITAKGSVHVGSLASQGLVLTNIRADCTFDHGVLTLAPMSAQIFGGTDTGSITMDTKAAAMPATLKLKLDNVDANQLLSATTSVKNKVYGQLGASGDISMNLGDTNAIVRTLNGNLTTSLTKGRLANVNVIRELSSIGKFLGGGAGGGENATNIEKLGGDLRLTNGLATTNNLQMQIQEGSLAAVGSVNLVDQSMNLKLTAVLAQPVSQKFGGSGVGGYLQTALANKNGELVIPAIVTGTFDHPQFAPDVAAVAQMKLKNALPTSGGIQSILGAITGKQPEQQANQPNQQGQQTQPNPLGALDSLFHRKKK